MGGGKPMSSPDTLTRLFFEAVDRFSSKQAAMRYKKEGTWHDITHQELAWHDITHQELARRVKHAALGLMELGTKPGDRVAILSQNCPEWAIADYACLTARCIDVAVYPTLPANQVAYILKDSGARAAFVEDKDQFEKIAAHKHELPELKYVISFPSGLDGPDLLSLEELYQRGRTAEPRYPNYEEDAMSVGRDDVATFIYTSGTTAEPKGVMLTHYNIASNVEGALKRLDIGPEDRCLSVLPLSHSFERMAGHYTMLHAGTTINYVEAIEELVVNMGEVNPTITILVPRIYEKIYARVLESALAGGALKRRIFFWARKTADNWSDLKLAGKPIPRGLAFKKNVAHRLVFSKLQAKTGGRIRFFVSGAAPLAPEIAQLIRSRHPASVRSDHQYPESR
jgi:long-chain acyl-CoA synthetase